MIRDIRHFEHQIDISFHCPTLSIPIMRPMSFTYGAREETRREHGYMLRNVADSAAGLLQREIIAKLREQGHLL